MKTICDTNIWRKLALGEIVQEDLLKADSQLIATIINIEEIAKSDLVLSDFEMAKQTIREIMKVPASIIIFENPIIYLQKLDNPSFQYDAEKENKLILELTEKIAQGYKLIDIPFYEKYIKEGKQRLQHFCDLCNNEANLVKNKISDKKELRKLRNDDIIPSNRLLVSTIVKSKTGNELSDNFDWQQIELFEKVFGLFASNMETIGLKMKPNDVYDLFQLIYVQPTDKFWTYDKRILKYIKESKMEKYLFDNKNVT